jgi:hypothetical protein
MQYFIESNGELFANQLDKFATELPTYKAVLGFTDAEVAEAVADAAFMKWTVKKDSIMEDYAHSFKAFEHNARYGKAGVALAPPAMPIIDAMPAVVKDGIQARFAQKVKKAKAANGVTEEILKALGIAGSSSTASREADENDTPDLKVSLNAGYPHISFHLFGYEAVNIYKDAGNGYVPFKTVHRSPVKDTQLPAAGVAANYKYKAIYVDHDQETGKMSAEISVAVVGR